jgi:hypothetical protein
MANNMPPPVAKKSRMAAKIAKAAQDEKTMDRIRDARYAHTVA